MLSIGSIVFGLYLNKYPFVIENANEYEVIGRIFGSELFANAFIVLGVSKLLCIHFNWRKGRLIALSLLIALWALFGVGFYIQYQNGNNNAGWIFVAIIVAQSWGITQRNVFTKKGDCSNE